MSGLLSKRQHQENWQNGWDRLTQLYNGFRAARQFQNLAKVQWLQLRKQWLLNTIRAEAETIVVMGEAYRALDLKKFYEV